MYKYSNHAGDAPDIISEAAKQPGPTEEPKVKKAPPSPKGKTSKNINFDDKVKADKDDGDEVGLKKKKAKMVGDDPNPQRPDAFGPDGISPKTGKTRISRGWAADESIQKLHNMKIDMYDLECQMSDRSGLNENKVKSIQSKIKSLKDKIEDLSNDMHGSFGTSHEY